MEELYVLFNIKDKTFYKDYINCGSYRVETVKIWKTFKGAKDRLDGFECTGIFRKEDYEIRLLSTKKMKG